MKKVIKICVLILLITIICGDISYANWEARIPSQKKTLWQKFYSIFLGDVFYILTSEDWYETKYNGENVLVNKKTNKIEFYQNAFGVWLDLKDRDPNLADYPISE